MRTHVIARKTHKWLGLFIGLQVVIWSLSGLYMTVVHIDTIHGDHLIRRPVSHTIPAKELADPIAAMIANDAQSVRLTWLRGQPIYVANSDAGETAIDARTGAAVQRPNEAEIRAIATAGCSHSPARHSP